MRERHEKQRNANADFCFCRARDEAENASFKKRHFFSNYVPFRFFYVVAALSRGEARARDENARGEKERERGGRGKGKGRGRGRGKGKEWRVRGVERVGWLGIYDVPVHESDEGAKKRKDGGGETGK